jgi:hypothetical protein
MISNKLLDEAFDALLEIDATVDVPFVPMDKAITTNIEAPPTRQDGPIAHIISKDDDDDEDDEEDENLEEQEKEGSYALSRASDAAMKERELAKQLAARSSTEEVEEDEDEFEEWIYPAWRVQTPVVGPDVPEVTEEPGIKMNRATNTLNKLTSRAESLFFEQTPVAAGTPDQPAVPAGTVPTEVPGAAPGMVPAPGMDAGMAGGMGGMGMGMGMDTTQTQLSDPGRALELKKIFSRLLSLQNFLSSSIDQGLAVLRDYVLKAVELFRTVIDNLASYKEKIDDIIVLFYDFIERCYSVLKEYYKIKEEQSKENSITVGGE